MKKITVLFLLICFFIMTLAGCSSKEPSSETSLDSKEPINLKVYGYSANMTDSEFQKYFVEPIKKKYPNISLELITRNGDNNTPEQLIAAGNFPDLLLVSNIYIGMFNRLGMTMDISELAKKNKLDLNRFDAGAMEAIQQFGSKDQLFALPLSANYGITLYNKDIFDKFGVPYPKDLMTWNEMLDTGRKLTRLEQGVQYIGIDPGPVDQMKEQYALPYVNDKQDMPVLNSPGYQKLFALLKSFYEVPGFIGPNNVYTYGSNAFFKNRNVALLPSWGNGVVGMLEDATQQGQNLNWDIVTQPVYSEFPNIGRPANMPVLMVSPKTAHKDAVFQVINTLVGDEVQTLLNRNGRLTILNDDKIKSQFAADLKSFQGKNTQAVTKLKQAASVPITDYDVELKKIIQNAAKDMAQSGKDVNTILREAQSNAEKKMAEMKQQ
ncbi:extracellular solute-binding protein [Paenibacillus sp. H1-7]|uniref:ABC transporter substrate-binding protein n=1 Tax=Paenibacillus sp. H1-7 TaxID=2282849 RepID=UPI001EF8368C|nr:extracellular solute-binding protein [Paenibacillus sp. H1-7]ULL16710.1 extracellular solute-binding protein [Paenibacillus sp. H1-7]